MGESLAVSNRKEGPLNHPGQIRSATACAEVGQGGLEAGPRCTRSRAHPTLTSSSDKCTHRQGQLHASLTERMGGRYHGDLSSLSVMLEGQRLGHHSHGTDVDIITSTSAAARTVSAISVAGRQLVQSLPQEPAGSIVSPKCSPPSWASNPTTLGGMLPSCPPASCTGHKEERTDVGCLPDAHTLMPRDDLSRPSVRTSAPATPVAPLQPFPPTRPL